MSSVLPEEEKMVEWFDLNLSFWDLKFEFVY